MPETRPPQSSPKWPGMVLRAALMLAAGGMHAVAWVLPGYWPFAWVGQAAAVMLGVTSRPRTALACGTIAGALGIACSFYWGVEALRTTFDASPLLAWAIFAGLVGLEAAGFGAFCYAVSVLARGGVRGLWLAPCAWVVVEYWFPRVFPWKLGYSQLEMLPLLQVAALVGPAGIGFVVTAVTAVPAAIWLGFRLAASDVERRRAVAFSTAALCLLIATLGYGYLSQSRWDKWCAQAPKLKLALIQVDPIYVGSEKKLRERSLAVHDQVDFICWPESSIGIYSEKLAHFRDVHQTMLMSRMSHDAFEPAKDFACHLLAGGKLFKDGCGQEGPYSTAAFLIAPTQDILGRYRKRTLLPFGEYIPGQSWYPEIRRWATIHEVMEAGREPGPLIMTGGHRFGLIICYEDTLPENARQTVAAGAQALFSLIQGTAFENPLTLVQHERLALLRAVENRRYFVRCASTGVTCIIDPTGRVVSQLPVQTEGTLVGEIALIDSLSLYTRIGDLFPWCCTAVVVAGLWLGRRKRSLR